MVWFRGENPVTAADVAMEAFKGLGVKRLKAPVELQNCFLGGAVF